MADESTTKKKPTGRTFNFNLVGDDLHLYETVRDIYQDEQESEEATVASVLGEMDPQIRALLESRFAPKPARREMSQRQVFVRALGAALAALEAAEDARVEAEAAEGEVNGADTEGGDDA